MTSAGAAINVVCPRNLEIASASVPTPAAEVGTPIQSLLHASEGLRLGLTGSDGGAEDA
jgi:hypothetical protein